MQGIIWTDICICTCRVSYGRTYVSVRAGYLYVQGICTVYVSVRPCQTPMKHTINAVLKFHASFHHLNNTITIVSERAKNGSSILSWCVSHCVILMSIMPPTDGTQVPGCTIHKVGQSCTSSLHVQPARPACTSRAGCSII